MAGRRRLGPGDAWEREILTAIRRTIKLFVPIVSANTEQAEEGYVFREWREAAYRSQAIPRRHFIVPVVIDEDYEGDPSRYQQIQTTSRPSTSVARRAATRIRICPRC